MFRYALIGLALVGSILPAAVIRQANASDLERGKYLVEAITACDNCHTPRGPGGYILNRRFSGGSQIFTDRTYSVRGSNITPETTTGVGAWPDMQLKAAIVDGVAPSGQLAPVMPADSYRVMSESDLDSVIAYLRTATPLYAPLSAPQRREGIWARHQLPGAETPMTGDDLKNESKRGLYIASLARCLACHSGETNGEPDYRQRLGEGGKLFRTPGGVAVASNITSHPVSGVGAWTDDEIKRAITQGVSRDGRPLKPTMANLSQAHFSKMAAADLDALVAWLRTIPPGDRPSAD